MDNGRSLPGCGLNGEEECLTQTSTPGRLCPIYLPLLYAVYRQEIIVLDNVATFPCNRAA